MPSASHAQLTGTALHGPFRYEQGSDPGAVGYGSYWLDTSGTPPFALKRRNGTNSDWDLVGSYGLTDPTTLQGDLIVRGASSLARLAIGSTGTVLRSNGTTAVWSSSPTVTGESTAGDFNATGLSGATAGARFVGGTTSGAPVSGTFLKGDFIIDQTGKAYICTTAGTPGTWALAASGLTNPMTTQYDLILGGVSGTPTRLPVGSNGQVLAIVSGIPTWSASGASMTNPMNATGSMIRGTSGGVPQELVVGANGQALMVVAGIPAWANPSSGYAAVAGKIYLSKVCY